MVLQQLSVSSLARLNYLTTTSSSFRVDLNNPIIGKINSISLKSCTIPNVIYNINTPTNELLFIDSVGNDSIVIPSGNYSVFTLIVEIELLLNATVDTYLVAYNESTGKITFTSDFAGFTLRPGNTVITTKGEIFESPPSLNWQLGFEPLTIYPSVVGVLEAPNVPSLQGLERVYIRINQFKQFYRNTVSTFFNFDIPLSMPFNGIEYYEENDGSDQTYTLANSNYVNIGNLDVQLLNAFGSQIRLNGADWGFVVEYSVTEQ